MKRNQIIYLFLLVFLLSSTSNFASVFNAVATGNWSDSSSWDKGNVPTALDTVLIDGFTITVDDTDGDITINQITITNSSGSDNSYLVVSGSRTLTVTNGIDLTSENQARIVRLRITNNTIVNVGGNMTLTRTTDNNVGNGLDLSVEGSSRLNVSGNVSYDYKNSKSTESSKEIKLTGNAIMDITGDLYCYIRAGNEFELQIMNAAQLLVSGDVIFHHLGGDDMVLDMNTDAQLHISGTLDVMNSGGINTTYLDFFNQSIATVGTDLRLKADNVDDMVLVELHGFGVSSSLTVAGDIIMDASSEGDLTLQMANNSNLYLGGEFVRINNYGILDMGSSSTLTYNGSSAQVLATNDLSGSGTDAFYYSNIGINNTSGSPITLKGNIIVNQDLTLTNGIIKTTDTTTLTIADGATITGGSENAYVDGPIIKQGSTNKLPFVFPTGEGSSYGPIEISAVKNSASQYTAQYFGCPPPFGAHLATGVDQVSSGEYWTLKRTSGSDAVNVTLHWMDAAASGITDTESLIVTYYDAINGWTSVGNGGITGGVGSGISGSVSNLLSCPPPFGGEKFTFGTISALTPLPVELTRFTARQDGFDVLLEWETHSETNSSHFVVEKSEDGIMFQELTSVQAQGFSSNTSYYSTRDINPGEDKNYYRLHQVDIDGMSEYSEIVVVSFEPSENKLILFPNPVLDCIKLSSKDHRELETTIDIFDQMGQLLYSGVQTMTNGTIRIPTNEINMPSTGNYFIILQNESGIQSLQFVKTN